MLRCGLRRGLQCRSIAAVPHPSNHPFQLASQTAPARRWVHQPAKKVATPIPQTPGATRIPDDGLSLADFAETAPPSLSPERLGQSSIADCAEPVVGTEVDTEPAAVVRSYFIETYGCQMNVSDSEIVRAVLEKAGMVSAPSVEEAGLILVNTCSIRDNAEQKIWDRLDYFRSIKRKYATKRYRLQGMVPPKVGVLGCMAERLKQRLLEADKLVDLVAGPDAYRDLPRLLGDVESGQSAMNTQLSLDETYADIAPVRESASQVSAFVSIMRGCDQFCSYCIVPFTRGRERSRSAESIVKEVEELSRQGFKEVVLLGQNVNSYNDLAPLLEGESSVKRSDLLEDTRDAKSRGFTNISKRPRDGVAFPDLLRRVAAVDADMRVRYTSPHPKDFPDALIQAIKDLPNICAQIHLPVQSGSSEVLRRMRRGYTSESYLALARLLKAEIPRLTLSTDIIAGFCEETEDEHRLSLDLMREVGFEQAFMFKYSERENTTAHKRMADDVPEEVKQRRLQEIIEVFRQRLWDRNEADVGSLQLVLVEGRSKKSANDLSGRSDGNKKVIFPKEALPDLSRRVGGEGEKGTEKIPEARDYVIVRVEKAGSNSLIGRGVGISNIEHWHQLSMAPDTHTE